MLKLQRSAVLIALCLATICFCLANASISISVSRLIQYDSGSEEGMLGSRRTSFYLNAFSPASLDVADYFEQIRTEKNDSLPLFARRILFVHADRLTLSGLHAILNSLSVQALLIVVPSECRAPSSDAAVAFHEVESYLVNNRIDIPVYFATEAEVGPDVLAQLRDGSLSVDAAVLDREASVLAPPATSTVQSHSSGSRSSAGTANFQYLGVNMITSLSGVTTDDSAAPTTSKDSSRRTIAVVAHYDRLHLAPGLSGCSDSGSSAIVAVLELSRLFGKLYSQQRSRGSRDVLFLLTSGGPLNYAGTQYWLDHANEKLVDSLEFVLAVESLDANDLFLHLSRSPADPLVAPFVDRLTNVSAHLSIPLTVQQKKVNVADTARSWHHEVFSFRRVPGATISSFAQPHTHFTSASLVSSVARADSNTLTRNVRFVAESVLRFVYDLDAATPAEFFAESLDIHAPTVDHFSTFLQSFDRNAANISTTHPIVQSLYQNLLTWGTTQTQEFRVNQEYRFYDRTTVSLTLYQTKSFGFDLILMLFIFGWGFVIYAYLKGFETAFRSISGAFSARKTTTKGKKK